jgi:hypothetical protein
MWNVLNKSSNSNTGENYKHSKITHKVLEKHRLEVGHPENTEENNIEH